MRECNLSLNSEKKQSQELSGWTLSLMAVLSATNVSSYFYELTEVGKIIE